MGRKFVTVTEFHNADQSLLMWVTADRTTPGATVYTSRVCVRSPLTGAWLAETDQDATGRYSMRFEPRQRRKGRKRDRGALGTLRHIRALNLGGNGRRYGGHSTVDRVLLLPGLDRSARFLWAILGSVTGE